MAMNRSTLLTLIAVFLFNQNVIADINAANAALARGDYAAASTEFLRLAKAGDAKAQAHLGYMYYVGEGVEQDYSEAVKWYRKAATQGNKDAQYNLAVAHAFGEGTKQDYKESANWYRRASEQGHPVAQYSLGISYSYGEGVKQDGAEAVKWFRQSADQGYARSQVQLATKYHTGDGVALNYQEAVKWYRKAADKGNIAAQYNLGSMYRSGKGVPQDYNQSVRWYRMAADRGYAAAINELASLERAIAGAQRSRSKPDLQPAPRQQIATVKEETPAEDPLLTVEKSELLTLDSEEEAAEEAVMAEAEPAVEYVDESYQEAAPEEKKPGRISGFFKKFFKKNETPVETEIAAASETIEAADDTRLAMGSSEDSVSDAVEEDVPVEDLSETLSESTDEMEVEREVVENETTEKKSRFGFFKKLFGKKDTTEDVTVEDHSVEDLDSDASMDSASDAVVTYGTDENMSGDAMTDITEFDGNETEATLPETVAETDTEVSEEKPKKWGFFKRLFGKDKDDSEDVAETMADESEQMANDTVAMVDDSTASIPILEEEVAIDTNAEEDAAMDALEVGEKPKKKGFFKRLFGKDKDDSEDVAETMADESEQMANDTVAMVDDSTDNIPILEEEVAIDTSAEEDAAMNALEVEEKPKKKGFFKRLFGKKDKDTEEVDSQSEEMSASEETGDTVYPSGPAFVAETEDLEAALQALDSGDYDSAYNSFYDLATSGDASAQYQLGLLYYQGLGIRQDYNEASHWYRLASEQGNADAQYSLGNMYLMGEGVSQDDSEAIAWYEKAAAQGHIAAEHNVNNLRRITSNKSASAEEIESALENEQMEDTLSDSADTDKPKKGFFKRLFGKKDKTDEDLIEEETSTAVQGPLPEIQPEAEPEIAEIEEVKKKKKGFFGRLFGKKDTEEEVMAEATTQVEPMESTESVEPIAEPEQSFDEAVTSLKEYEKGLAYSFGDGVPQDDNAAFEAFLRSAELGHTPAQYKTGVAYAYGEGVDKDPGQAVFWYKKAAKKGYALAQRNLGVMYLNGDGVEQNKPLAFAWHSILADSGNVMDVHRRDSLQQQLSQAEFEEALAIKASLKR